MKIAIAFLILLIACTPPTNSQEKETLLDRALELHHEVPLIDGHNDLPWQYWQKARRDLSRMDIGQHQPLLHTDISRMRKGVLGAQFWSAYVPATTPRSAVVSETLEQIDLIHRMVQRYPDAFELAATADDVERVFRSGKIASLIGVEGGHSIGNSLGILRIFYKLGVRYMTLTHNTNVDWADSATDKRKHGGLSPFGKSVVKEMNWLGMLVDLSHVSAETMHSALLITEAPVIFSHSSARGVTDHTRNVPDDVLAKLPANGGVVMVTFVPAYVSAEVKAWEAGASAARPRPGSPPRATMEQVADHIDHIRRVAGIDHIGLGSDFDGTTAVPRGLEDVSTYPLLTAELLRRGYSSEDIKKILGLNMLRAMRRAEAVAARLHKERPASAAVFDPN